MGRVFLPFGETPTDRLVKRWLEARGIDPNDVAGYVITRTPQDLPMITLTMFYEEEKEDG